MKSYIIRIYRENVYESHGFAGIVEDAGLTRQTPFHSLEELGQILNVPKQASSTEKDNEKENGK